MSIAIGINTLVRLDVGPSPFSESVENGVVP
jgi:hypothetical protein